MAKKMAIRSNKKKNGIDFDTYFKVGVSPEYILIRDDFPMQEISPGDFARLTEEMFRRNDEVFNGK